MKYLFYITLLLSLGFSSCSKTVDNTGTCSDGRQNQGEQGVDCGGPCIMTCPSCADGIMNQNETAVDCGGQCDQCYPGLSALVNNLPWNSTSRNAFISGPGIIRIYGTNQQKNMTLFYSGDFKKGTVQAGTQFKGEFRDLNGNVFSSDNTGSITFTTFDTTAKKIAGIYSFVANDTVNNKTIFVTSGVFTELRY